MWGIVAFLVGIAYGYFSPGKTDKSRLYLRAFLWGLLIAVVFVAIGWLTGFNPLGIAADPVGFLIGFAVTLLLFVLGVWLGDAIESRRTRRGTYRRRAA